MVATMQNQIGTFQQLQRTDPDQAAVIDGAYRNLARMVLLQAYRDTQQTADPGRKSEAADWLQSDDAREMAKFAGLL